MDLERWVHDNNPEEQLQYSKGWWDYIELIRRLMYKFGAKEAQVVAAYPMRTPPPEEDLLMPAVQFAVGSTADLATGQTPSVDPAPFRVSRFEDGSLIVIGPEI
jgi:hypothetical protein